MKLGKLIKDIERIFEICGCTEDQKVLYNSYLFQVEAMTWWDAKRQLLIMELGSKEAISWERFEKKFGEHYFPTILRQQKLKEFASLVQGGMTVE